MAWIALIPLLIFLDSARSVGSAFKGSFLCGVIFFAGVLYWIYYVTLAGTILLVLYLSLYFGLFGVIYFYSRQMPSIAQLLVIPAGWVVTEFLRSRLLTGFSWAALGLTQYERLVVIQIADWGGVYAVSFVLVLVNLALKQIGMSIFFFPKKKDWRIVAVAAGVVTLVIGYGMTRMARPSSGPQWKTAVIQGNIDLETRWRETAWLSIIETYLDLTRQAAAEQPDVIIWPETAFPAYLWEDEIFLSGLRDLIDETGVPVLFGAVVHEEERYFNAAILLSSLGQPAGHYFKNHLVPYGEYIPFRKYFPFLSYIIPIDDFSAGEEVTVLRLPESSTPGFSVLICFEDTVSQLVRQFVLGGAEVLVNITNDAWFRDSQEPFMHLQSAVFRAVEYRRSVIRAANTGISAFIDPQGRILDAIQDPGGKLTWISGYQTREVPLSQELTLYARFGDVFAWFCGVLTVLVLLFSLWGRNRPAVSGLI